MHGLGLPRACSIWPGRSSGMGGHSWKRHSAASPPGPGYLPGVLEMEGSFHLWLPMPDKAGPWLSLADQHPLSLGLGRALQQLWSSSLPSAGHGSEHMLEVWCRISLKAHCPSGAVWRA